MANSTDKRYEYHHTNTLGSNIILTDDDQNVQARYQYDVFGAIRSETGTSDNTRKFTGKEYDADVRLYYYGARYYDPYIARFTQRDPASDGVNWYIYARNRPLKFVDPTGLRPVNAIEADALIYTFGNDVGNFLITRINIVFMLHWKTWRGRVPSGTRTTIELYGGYNPHSLGDLALFIHEATHIWQKNTGLHRGGKGGVDYDYTLNQLHSLNLKREEHAEAVEEWFYVNYAYTNGLIGSQVSADDVWKETLHKVMKISDKNIKKIPDSAKIWLINVHYERLIDEIQDPTLLPPRLGQNFPNPL